MGDADEIYRKLNTKRLIAAIPKGINRKTFRVFSLQRLYKSMYHTEFLVTVPLSLTDKINSV
jgi:hypothetical protein